MTAGCLSAFVYTVQLLTVPILMLALLSIASVKNVKSDDHDSRALA